MSAFAETIKFNLKHNSKVEKFCEPLKSGLNIIHFWYQVIDSQCNYICLGSNVEWVERYFSTREFYLRNPLFKSPQSILSGVSIIDKNYTYPLNNDEDYKNIRGIKNLNTLPRLIFIERINDKLVEFGFTSKLHPSIFKDICINEISLLKFFTKKFSEEFAPIFTKNQEKAVNIAPMIGQPLLEGTSPPAALPALNQKFLEHFQLSELLNLSAREKEVLYHISRGLFAVQIAEILQLSQRTVEHYSDNIKNKLNCESKTELIQKANDFLLLGYSLI